MGGIYFHIPFCKQACHYCNFHFSTNLSLKERIVSAMVREIELVYQDKTEITLVDENLTIQTIYFGGGTPSLLEAKEIALLLQTVRSYYRVTDDAEITLEANPDDINEDKLNDWKKAGINRFSLGIQSLSDAELKWMNRAHNSGQALRSIELIKQAGFSNFSIDIIYGTPGSIDETWREDMDRLIALGAPHIACYALTVEENTALEKMIRQNKKANTDDDQQSEQFLYLMDVLEGAGYEQYEISNFAKPGFRSRHNSNYWKGISYIGIGPSAHSFYGNTRRWNLKNNSLYISSIEQNKIPYEKEMLSEKDLYNEYVMTGLRMFEGINLETIEDRFGKEKWARILELSRKYIHDEKLILKGNDLFLTNKGRLLADGIAANLFL